MSVWQPTSQEIMDGFSASCEIGPTMILVSRWGALLHQPSASLSNLSVHLPLSNPHPDFLTVFIPLRLSAVLSADTNTAVCVSCDYVRVPCTYLPHGLQMGFTNTYQDWLPISCRVKNNITGAKNSPFNKCGVTAPLFLDIVLCL